MDFPGSHEVSARAIFSVVLDFEAVFVYNTSTVAIVGARVAEAPNGVVVAVGAATD